MTNIDLNPVPKNFADNFLLGLGKDHFVVAMTCGNNIQAFALGRTLGKELYLKLKETIEKSEAMFGEINMESGITSPIQLPSPEKPGDKNKKK